MTTAMTTARYWILGIAISATCALIAFYSAEATSPTPVLPEAGKVGFKFLIIVAWYAFVAICCTEAVLREIRELPAKLAEYVDEQTGNARIDTVRDLNRGTTVGGQRGRPHLVD